ncbi:MAG: hypothetical protein ABEJ81_03870 [Haloferacaceae archaeon]
MPRIVDDPSVESSAPTGTAIRTAVGRVVRTIHRSRTRLWLVAVLFFAVGDVATTSVGLGSGRIAEAGPVAAPLIGRYGIAALVALKVGTFGCCYLLYRVVPRPHDAGVPLGLATIGVVVTGWNLAVMAVVGVL